MTEGPFTWRDGKLVPQTEELMREDLERASEGFVVPPPQPAYIPSKAESKRAKLHMYWDGVPWWVRFLQVVVSFFNDGPWSKEK